MNHFKIWVSLLFFGLLINCPVFAKNNETFFSVAAIVNQINTEDIGQHKLLKVAPPPLLYHWLSIESLNKRMFPKLADQKTVQLKPLGNNHFMTLLATKAPAFQNRYGLFAWHNPVGATSGGSAEVYGNGESLLALKLDTNLRVGLIVTDSGFGGEPHPNLKDPQIIEKYDLVLHVNGYRKGKNDKSFGYIEWVLLNPNVITAFTVDPDITTKEMDKYKNAISEFRKSGQEAPISIMDSIAGPQHTLFGSMAINEERIEKRKQKLLSNIDLLPLTLRLGWKTIQRKISCSSIF